MSRPGLMLLMLLLVGASGVVVVRSLASDTPTSSAGSSPSAGATADVAAPGAARAAPLDGPVTRVATGAATPPATSLVEQAPTLVVADPVDRIAAAHLALRLRSPLLLVGQQAGSAAQPSPAASPGPDAVDGSAEAPSDPGGSPPTSGATADTGAVPSTAPGSTGAGSALPPDDALGEARRLRVGTAVVVGDADLADLISEANVDEVVQLDAPARPFERTRAVIARAAGGHQLGREPDLGLPAGPVRDLVDRRPPPAEDTGAAVLVRPNDGSALPAVLAARAIGHRVVATAAVDLRADAQVVRRMARLGTPQDPPPVVVAGTQLADRDPDGIASQVAAAATGTQLPGGGQLVIDPARPDARRYVGLYGTPGSGALGVLGEQPAAASVRRARQLARRYRAVVDDDVTIIPTFEIIATIASGGPGKDRNFSAERPVRELRPSVEAARRAGVYVLLDLQPGRTDFLTQARRYRELLREPHVGLALDPEWRLRPGERHLEQIGSVGIDEVNEVGDWLADLVERRRLPQKIFLLHQFRTSMIRGRARLDTSRDELAHVIQMDGQGPQDTKLETWRALLADRPDGTHFGWKNFYDEDQPTRSPADTMAIDPTPVFVSYQ